jgi:uncharacterized protein (DUF849 family)
MRKLIVTCAVTGSGNTVEKNPAVPVTPEQIAASSVEAAAAGASIIHIHVRNRATGRASNDPSLFSEVVDRIRESGCDAILNLSTGRGARYVPADHDPLEAAEGSTLRDPIARVQHVLGTRPEICSLDIVTMNRQGFVTMNTPEHCARMAAAIFDAGVLPELEVFDAGHMELTLDMIRNGQLARPGFFQFCLGIKWGMPANAESVLYLRSMLPQNAVWSAFAIGSEEFPMVALAAVTGGHVRVGLEDNLYIDRGELASSNAVLVERAVTIIQSVGHEVATPTEARKTLGLTKGTSD